MLTDTKLRGHAFFPCLPCNSRVNHFHADWLSSLKVKGRSLVSFLFGFLWKMFRIAAEVERGGGITFLFLPSFPQRVPSIRKTLYLFNFINHLKSPELGIWLSTWLSGKESACQCRRPRRCGFDPQVAKIPWSRKWQSAAVFLPRKFHDRGTWQATVSGVTRESDMT